MSNDAASIFPIINSLISAILGGVTVTIINFLLNRPKIKAELDKTKAETEKLNLDMNKTKAETEKLRLETDRLRSETENKQKKTDDTLDHHQKQLDWTVSALSKIVAYMPGYFAHQALCQIRDRKDEYYNDSNSHKKRILQLLLDNGYLQPPLGTDQIVFSEQVNGKRLFEIAELTPMAELFLQLREEVTKKSTNA